MTNIFFLKCFIINFVVNFMYRMFNEKSINENFSLQEIYNNTVKPLNSGHLWVLKNVSVIERCLLLGGNLKKIVTFGAKHFVRYSRHVRCLRFSLLGGFHCKKKKQKWKYCDFLHAINCPRELTCLWACACAYDCTHLREQYDLQCLDCWKMHLWNFPSPMVWSNHSICKTTPLFSP